MGLRTYAPNPRERDELKRAGITRAGGRWVAGAGLATMSILAPVGAAFADTVDEDYPPAATNPPVTPTTAAIPKTGNDGTDAWLKMGAGAVLAGGVLVAGTSRRRREVETT